MGFTEKVHPSWFVFPYDATPFYWPDMPRQAHGRPLQQTKPARTPKPKPVKGRGLSALQIAEKEGPDAIKIRQHRLGETFDDPDEPQSRHDVDDRSSKRRKLNDVSDEDEESGSDVDGDHWHVGMNEDDEDSDIESDEAFGESDEERFAGFTFRGSAGNDKSIKGKRLGAEPSKKHGFASRDEEVFNEEDDFGEDAVDLATAWDMDEQLDNHKDAERPATQGTDPDEDAHGSETSDDNEDDDDEDGDDDSDKDDESMLSVSEDEEGDHARLQSFVKGLPRENQPVQSKGLPIGSSSIPAKKLSAADLMQYVKDPNQRESLKILQNSEAKAPEAYRGGIPGRLAPPLAKRLQDRLDRSAAYDESKKELGKWTETVKRNRRAEHLSFPLIDPDAAAASGTPHLIPLADQEPQTSLEAKIQEIMQDNSFAGTRASTANQEEEEDAELKANNIPLAEIQARRAELRRQRDLMFREEIRARRIKKIKSKAYRRIHRKQLERMNLENRAQLIAAGLVDSEEERERDERRRAEERMGARHRESKWAKGVKRSGRAAWDEDARQGVGDLARRDEELRRKVQGNASKDSDDSTSESDSNEDRSDDDQVLRAKINALEANDGGGHRKGLENMDFMKKAEAARKATNDAELSTLKRQLEDENGDLHKNDREESDEDLLGRRKFGTRSEDPVSQSVAPLVNKSEFEEPDSDSAEQEPGFPSTMNAKKHTDVLREHVSSHRAPSPLVGSVENATLSSTYRKKKPVVFQQTHKAGPPEKTSDKVQMEEQTLDAGLSHSESEAEPGDGTGPQTLAEDVFFGPDDVVKEFETEKRDTVAEEDDQIVDNSLPGWGSWAGAGISKKRQRRDKGQNLTTVKGVAPEKRQDATLRRVIINEKRNKKNNKYLAPELPHPFESRQQYERSLRLPLGPEWTTRSTFQDATKPRVLVKQGVIKPMTKPLA